MQVCPKCGAKIKYIATGYTAQAVCEAEPLEVVNDNGHRFKGYPLHKCKEDIKTDERNNEKQ